eukprot:jgi/Psemu1/5177/gm1.5177_g
MAKTSGAEEPEEKLCRACTGSLPKDKFSNKQWLGSVEKQTRRCKVCVASGKEAGAVTPQAEEATEAAAAQPIRRGKVNKKKKEAPTYAGNHKTGLYTRSTGTSDVKVGLASRTCAWCGKAEEKNKLLLECSVCRNISYCSKACSKAAYPEHKLMCQQMKKDREDAKKERKAMERAANQGAFTLTKASGTGHVAYNCMLVNVGKFCTVSYFGELRGTQPGVYEEPGHHFASDASRNAMRRLLGAQKFNHLRREMARHCFKQRDSLKLTHYFTDVKELDPVDQFLLSCGPLDDIEHAKLVLPAIIHKISYSGLKPDGTIPNIGDIKVWGYGLNALEWASRRGN